MSSSTVEAVGAPVTFPGSRPRPRLLVPDAHYRRRPSDVVRVVSAVLLLVVAALVTRTRGEVEGTFGSFVTSLPGWTAGGFRVVYSVGSVAVMVSLVVLVVAMRRWRLAGSLVLATVVCTGVVVALHAWLDPGASTPPGVEELRSFPVRRLAVSVAAFLIVRPHLVRPVRRFFDVLVVMTVLGAALVPAGLPFDVAAAFVVGWGAAALAALAIGAPTGLPTESEVGDTLVELGVPVSAVRLADHQRWGDQRFVADGPDGTLHVVVLGRDADDAQLLAKAWRTIWYRDSGPGVAFSRQHRVEQMAYQLMLADRRGAAVPEVVLAGVGGRSSTAALVTRRPTGVTLEALIESDRGHEVSDAALVDAWRSVMVMRSAGIAHGALGPDRVVIDGDRATIVDFTDASTSAPRTRRDIDLAELLVATTVAVGPERALTALTDVLGEERLAAVLTVLQPAALSTSTRKHVDDLKGVIADLTDRISAITGTDPPAPTELRRVSIGDIVRFGLTFFGVALILSMFAEVDWNEFWGALQGASWGWVLVALALSFLPAVTDAVATLGGLGPKLSLGPLVMMNYAGRFINVAVPAAVGQAAISIRFAQRQGVQPGAAISGGLMCAVTGFVVQVIVVVAALSVGVVDLGLDLDVRDSFSAERIGVWAFIAVSIVVATVLLVRGSIRLRRWMADVVRPQIGEARDGVRDVAEQPGRIVMLVGGNIGSQVVFGSMLTASLFAYGVEADVLLLALLANTAASLLGGLMPVPGGVGVWEGAAAAVLIAGGVDPTVATAAVLTHRMLTFYLPPIYGWFALRWLRQNDYL